MLKNKKSSEHGFLIPVVMMIVWLVFQLVQTYISQTTDAEQADFLESERVKALYSAQGAIEKVLSEWDWNSSKQTKWAWKEESLQQSIQVTLLPINSNGTASDGLRRGLLQAKAIGRLGVRQTISVQIDVEKGTKIQEKDH